MALLPTPRQAHVVHSAASRAIAETRSRPHLPAPSSEADHPIIGLLRGASGAVQRAVSLRHQAL
jgi:hypothetical protein